MYVGDMIALILLGSMHKVTEPSLLLGRVVWEEK